MSDGNRDKHWSIATDRPTSDLDAHLPEPGSPLLAVHRELPANPDSVRDARQLVGALLQQGAMERNRRDDVLLAVSEAVTNAVRHAYDEGRSGSMDLTVQSSASELAITVADHGRGLDRPSPSPGLGFGVSLIKQMADHAVFLANRQGGTTVEMTFGLSGTH